jgi:hypothetical protein
MIVCISRSACFCHYSKCLKAGASSGASLNRTGRIGQEKVKQIELLEVNRGYNKRIRDKK